MADFIELTTLDDYDKESKRVFNKNLITNIEQDKAHDQCYITYENKEYRVRESLTEINSKSAE